MQFETGAIRIRPALRRDFPLIREWDEFWGDRRQEMQRGELYVAVDQEDMVVGYVRVARNEFLNFPLVAGLCVRPDHRRKGIGIFLMRHVDAVLAGLRVFCTTETTNNEMLALLEKVGYKIVGHVDALNSDGSRELILCRDTNEESV